MHFCLMSHLLVATYVSRYVIVKIDLPFEVGNHQSLFLSGAIIIIP